MPATVEEVGHHYLNLLTAVAVRDDLRRRWGANPADDELHKRLTDQAAEVERQIRRLRALVAGVDVPPVEVPLP